MKKVITLIGICNFWIVTLISGQCVAGDCQNGLGGYLYLNGDMDLRRSNDKYWLQIVKQSINTILIR